MAGDDFLAPQSGKRAKRKSSRELGREARVARRNAARPEGLGLGAVEYQVGGIDGGGRQSGMDFDAPRDERVVENGRELGVLEQVGGKWHATTGAGDVLVEDSRADALEALRAADAEAEAELDAAPPERPPPPTKAEAAERFTKQLHEVTRNQLGRFVRVEKLRECGVTGCDVDVAPDLSGLLEQHDAFLESLEVLLRGAGDEADDLVPVVEAFRVELEDQRRDLLGLEGADAEALAARVDRDLPLLVQGPLEEAVDLPSLEGRDRSRLALLLSSWNPNYRGSFYKLRPGSSTVKVLRPGHYRIDLSHPFVKRSGIASEVWRQMRDPNDSRLWAVIEDPAEAAADLIEREATAWELEQEARERARIKGEL